MAINANTLGDYTHSEAPVEEAVVEETPNVEATEVSEEVEVQEDVNPWGTEHLVDENGMIGGKYKNMDAIMKSLEHAQGKLAELQGEKQSTDARAANEVKASEKASGVMQVEDAGVKAYLESGRNMTPEMVAEIEAGGGNATSVELKAIKAGQHIDKMTSIVGGEDTFNTMLTDMAEGKSEADKAAWLRSVSDPNMSEYAVKGLYAEWLEKTGQRASTKQGRISGKPSNVGSVKPYNSQGEVLAAAARARKDSGFRAEYEARKNATPDGILFNKK